jgi:DNA-binding XRE family transcriptional regulator
MESAKLQPIWRGRTEFLFMTQEKPNYSRYAKSQRTCRESIGLTRQQLAKLANVPVGVITSVERGHYMLLGEKSLRVRNVFSAGGARANVLIPRKVRQRLTPNP